MGIFTTVGLLAALIIVMIVREPRRVRIGMMLLWVVVSMVPTVAFWGLGITVSAVAVFSDSRDFQDVALATILLSGLVVAGLIIVVLIAMLIVNGVVMIRRESFAPAHVLSLGAGVGLLVYLTAGVFAVLLGLLQVAVWLAMMIFPIFAFAYSLVAYMLWSWLYGRLIPRLARPVNYVVVLGAGVAHGVRPLLAARLRTAMDWAERQGRCAGVLGWAGAGRAHL